MKIVVNGVARTLEVDPQMPLLWALRDHLGVLGPKYGCGVGACGACTVWIGGAPARSCVTALEDVDAPVTTIEGLPAALGAQDLTAVQQAWIDEQVPQCGYCQSGQIMAAAALLRDDPAPSDAAIDEAMSNLCRCGTYPRIRAAIRRAAAMLARASAAGEGAAAPGADQAASETPLAPDAPAAPDAQVAPDAVPSAPGAPAEER